MLLYFTVILGVPFVLGAINEWEHKYQPLRMPVRAQTLAKVIQLRVAQQ